eukprot:Phypoly_transcript_08789.p1 GENE.Phypoly_transcript_08789~~Phypoly_transcript_08789.p1  ORF type:complete len:379 (+),score=53.70 Phypoly_transcript_08789:148-1284(+)
MKDEKTLQLLERPLQQDHAEFFAKQMTKMYEKLEASQPKFKRILEVEFIGAYTILFLDFLQPGKWLVGPANNGKNDFFDFHLDKEHMQCHITISEVLGERMSPNVTSRLQKYFPKKENVGQVTVIEILEGFRLLKVPQYVCFSLHEWARGRRPGVIMCGFPTPLQVYEMMCNSTRCVSCLISVKDSTSIVHDEYPPYEDRNGLSFLFHDIKHLEKFVEPMYFDEQVAFLRIMRPLITTVPNANHCIKEEILAKYDEEFANDMDHLFSDMNACSSHLLQFFKAKWIDGEHRRCTRQGEDTPKNSLSEEQFTRFNTETITPLFQTCKDHLAQNEPEILQNYSEGDWISLREAFDKICTSEYTFEYAVNARNFFLKYAEKS